MQRMQFLTLSSFTQSILIVFWRDLRIPRPPRIPALRVNRIAFDFGRIPFDTNCFVAVAPLVHFHVIPLHSSARFHPDVETDIPTGLLRSVFPFQPTASSLLGVPLVCACLRVVQRDPMRCVFFTVPSLATRRTLQSSYRRTWKDEASRRRWRP